MEINLDKDVYFMIYFNNNGITAHFWFFLIGSIQFKLLSIYFGQQTLETGECNEKLDRRTAGAS